MKKNNGKKQVVQEKLLLFFVGLLHALCIAMAFHLDLFRRSSYSFASVKNINYWLGISSWWCIGVGGLTIIWVIYKLAKGNKTSYFEQVFDLTVLMANLLMILALVANFVIYYFWKVEGIYVPDTDNPGRTIKLFSSWQVKTQNYYGFNITISHLVVPFTLLYYFFKFGKANLLRKKLNLLSLESLVNPLIGLIYVILREKASNRGIHPDKISWDFPRNYPYVFFYRIMGQQAYEKDVNYSHSPISRFLWLTGVILIGFIFFLALAGLLIKGKEKEEKILTT